MNTIKAEYIQLLIDKLQQIRSKNIHWVTIEEVSKLMTKNVLLNEYHEWEMQHEKS